MNHQVKSKFYYIFWGVIAVSIVCGQIYVGTDYREMAEASKSSSINVTCVPPYEAPSSYAAGKNRTGEFE
jgi:hypothetical protein